LLVAVLMLGPAAHAAEGVLSAERATELLEKGNARYRVRDYPGALQFYQAAQEAGADPLVLFNLGQTHRKLGDLDKALGFFNRYLEAVPAAPNRPTVERLIQGVRAELERRVVRLVPGPSADLSATPVEPPPALGAAAAAETPARPSGVPWYRRWYVWVPIAVVVTGAAIGGGVAASRGGPPSTPLGNFSYFRPGAP
jgi:tetratricopeptide (TPR) repeat protein